MPNIFALEHIYYMYRVSKNY